MAKKQLSASEKTRYARHLNIPEVGEAGQLKLKAASVLVVGAGGLGSASATYLAAAGVGRLGIIDSDKVELSNLQRQIMHGMSSLGVDKVDSARKRLGDINMEIKIEGIKARVEKDNVHELLADFPIVVDATDNFETRYILNQACVDLKRTFIYGAGVPVLWSDECFQCGQGPCFQCVFRKMPSKEYMRANRGCGRGGRSAGCDRLTAGAGGHQVDRGDWSIRRRAAAAV